MRMSFVDTIRYSGIVLVGLTLSDPQSTLVKAYQLKYGIKIAVVGSDPAGLPGLTPVTAAISGEVSDKCHSLRKDLTPMRTVGVTS